MMRLFWFSGILALSILFAYTHAHNYQADKEDERGYHHYQYKYPRHEKPTNTHQDDSSDSSDDVNKYDPNINPYTPFPKFKAETLNFPKIFHRHCFGSSPFSSNCNGKTLTSVLLRQCLNIYHKAHYSVDILCPHINSGAPNHVPEPDSKNLEDSDSWERNSLHPSHRHFEDDDDKHHGEDIRPKVRNGNHEGHGHRYGHNRPKKLEYCSASNQPMEPTVGVVDYQYERCVQESYISITTAMVMCLTENIVRREFINYYFQDAVINPVEGPSLYLRKLHTFMTNVRQANRHNRINEHYPSLYMSMVVGVEQTVKYNPNVPYMYNDQFPLDEIIGQQSILMLLKDHRHVAQHTAGDGDGWRRFQCDHDDLDEHGCYRHSQWDHDMGEIDRCENSHFIKHFGRDHFRRCISGREGNRRREMYDCMRPHHHRIGKDNEDSDRRPESLIEAIVSSTVDDNYPILDGYGIPAYCALHACLATTRGNPEICFPESRGRNEYTFFQTDTVLWEAQRLSQKFDTCKANGWLDPNLFDPQSELARMNDLITKRSHTCVVENEMGDFLQAFEPEKLDFVTNTGFLNVVRGVGHQKCHEDDIGECLKPIELYEEIFKFLHKVLVLCEENRLQAESRKEQQECENEFEPRGRREPRFPNHCSKIVSDGDADVGISAIVDMACYTGDKQKAPGGDNLGCFAFDRGCRYCKVRSTAQAEHLYDCNHFGPNDDSEDLIVPKDCASQVSTGDIDAGVSAYNDATCKEGGLGCWQHQLCRFCKTRVTPQSQPYFPCPGVVIQPTAQDVQCQQERVAKGDIEAGVSAYYDENCLVGGLGCYSDRAKCRYCQVFRTEKSKQFMACPWAVQKS